MLANLFLGRLTGFLAVSHAPSGVSVGSICAEKEGEREREREKERGGEGEETTISKQVPSSKQPLRIQHALQSPACKHMLVVNV